MKSGSYFYQEGKLVPAEEVIQSLEEEYNKIVDAYINDHQDIINLFNTIMKDKPLNELHIFEYLIQKRIKELEDENREE